MVYHKPPTDWLGERLDGEPPRAMLQKRARLNCGAAVVEAARTSLTNIYMWANLVNTACAGLGPPGRCRERCACVGVHAVDQAHTTVIVCMWQSTPPQIYLAYAMSQLYIDYYGWDYSGCVHGRLGAPQRNAGRGHVPP